MIWAQSVQGAIGRDGQMPWHLPEDLRHFTATTRHTPVIMGRRTWESLPERFRPLPQRTNIVVSRTADYAAPGAIVVASLDEAIEAARQEQATDAETRAADAWIIGGGELYRQGLTLAETLVVTQIAIEVQGADTHAPEIGPEWRLVDPGTQRESSTGLWYRFERYARS